MRSSVRGRPRATAVPRMTAPPPRDSDVSLTSSRMSSIGTGRGLPITDRSYQLCAIRSINTYLQHHSFHITLRSTLPPAKDILECLKFVISRLNFPSDRLDDNLNLILKFLKCPVKLNKSALRAPGTPHSWPSLLAVIHWLVQIATYNDHLLESTLHGTFMKDDTLFMFALESYLHYIRGEDDALDELDREFTGKFQQEGVTLGDIESSHQKQIEEIQAKLEALRSDSSPREKLEKQKDLLEEDMKKFLKVIDQYSGLISALEKVLEEKGRELEAKEEETRRIRGENEDIKKRVEEQTVNSRDADRMKRELQAVERDIVDEESSRNVWDEKFWDLDSERGQKFKELEQLAMECNQAMKRLKFGKNSQYALNAEGLTAAEVLGVDYKSTIKPEQDSFADGIKNISMKMLEENISLQQQSVEYHSKIEARKKRITTLQSSIDEMEARLNTLKKEIQDYSSTCEREANMMSEAIELESHNMDATEIEVLEILMSTKSRMEETIIQSEAEVQRCVGEILVLIDSVSKYKEYMRTKVLEMKSDVSGVAGDISDAYKKALPAQFRMDFTDK